MPQVSRRGDLAQEALRPQGGGQLGTQDLHGDFSAVLEILGLVDCGHAALSQLPLDAVAIGEGGAEAVQLVGRHGEWERVSGVRDQVSGNRPLRPFGMSC